jgi:hypothetical protein
LSPVKPSPNRGRREKLAEFFLDLAKYSATVIVIGKLVAPENITTSTFIKGLIVSIMLTVIGYWVTPTDKE